MRAPEDTRSNGGGGAVCSLGFGDASERAADEAFARCAYEKRKAEPRKFRKAGEQLVILREAFAEADAGIEDDLRFWHARAGLRLCDGFFQASV